jgi:hypothetical protein
MAEGETGGLDASEMLDLLRGAGFTMNDHLRFCYGLNHLYVARKPDAAGSDVRRARTAAA